MELRELNKGTEIIETVNGKKMQWAGHVAEAKEKLNIKTAVGLHVEMEDKRRRGTPREDELVFSGSQ